MCLVCGGSVDDGASTPSDGVRFVCRRHGDYVVARSALPKLLRADLGAREGALDTARLFAKQRGGEIVITSLDL